LSLSSFSFCCFAFSLRLIAKAFFILPEPLTLPSPLSPFLLFLLYHVCYALSLKLQSKTSRQRKACLDCLPLLFFLVFFVLLIFILARVDERERGERTNGRREEYERSSLK
jgi:uncharacterized membrane protein YhhN